jgi:hypothetical protein
MKKEILHYLRAKYFKIYSLKIFAGQKRSLIGPDLARGPPYADRCFRQILNIESKLSVLPLINSYLLKF